jgi:hypothetical protein
LYFYDIKYCERRLELLRDKKKWIEAKQSTLHDLDADAHSFAFK